MNFFDIHSGIFSDLQEKNTAIYKQMQNYIHNWLLYLGEHWFEDIMQNPFIPPNINEDEEKRITINYIYRFIEKKIAFMWGEGFNIQYYDENTENNKKLDKFFKKVWSIWNNAVDICYRIGQCAMVCGDAYVIILVDEFDENGAFDLYKQKKIKLDVINPVFCIPKWHPRNPNEIIYFEYRLPNFDQDGNYTSPTKIIIDKNNIVIEEPNKNKQIIENIYGFVPVVHIQNKIISGNYFGKSEIEDISSLNIELNKSISNLSNILEYAGAPITIVKGASTKKIDKHSRVWSGLPVNAEVENLNLDTDLKAHLDYINLITESITKIAGIPPGGLGDIRHISNTSGVALTFMLLPLIEDIRLKKPNYEKGIKKLNELILKIGEKKGLIESSVINNMELPYEVDIYFNPTLPKDELLSVQVEDAKIKAGLSTRIQSMKELGISNPEKVEIDVYKQKYKDMLLRIEEQARLISLQKQLSLTNQNLPENNIHEKNNENSQQSSSVPFATGFEPDTGVHKEDLFDNTSLR